MAHFNGIPDTYTTRWNTHSTPINSSASRSLSTQIRKYNTSCDRCRKSRVKCSGGVPCRRCASSPGSPCVYSLSQRRGKKRVCSSNVLSTSNEFPSLEVTPSDSDVGAFNLEVEPTVEPQNVDSNVSVLPSRLETAC